MPIQIQELHTGDSGGRAGGASDVFLHVVTKRAGQIKGEAGTSGHEDDIAVLSWNWGVSANAAIGSTAGTARRSYRRLVLTKGIDAASTALMFALSRNDEVKEATLTMRKAGGEALDYFRMTLGNARIVEVDLEVPPNGIALERVTIAFTKIEVEYKRQQDTGLGAGSATFTDDAVSG